MGLPGLSACLLMGCSITVIGLVWNARLATAAALTPQGSASVAGRCTVDPDRGGADMLLAEQDENKETVAVGDEVLFTCEGTNGVGYVILTCAEGAVWSPNRKCTDQPKIGGMSMMGVGVFVFSFVLVTFIIVSSVLTQKKALGRML